MARKVHGHMSFGWAHSPAGSASRQPRPLCLPEMGVAIAPFCVEAKRASGAEPEGEEGTRGEGKKISGTRPRKLSAGNLFLPFFTFHLPQKDDLSGFSVHRTPAQIGCSSNSRVQTPGIMGVWQLLFSSSINAYFDLAPLDQQRC